MRTFEYREGRSDKFWTIDLQGASFTVTWGRRGTKGATLTKSFADPATARREHDRLVAEKLGKGYKETTSVAAASSGGIGAPKPTPLGNAIEAALFDNPDDLAAHMAYADHLNERGDPRGELIQVQLALEDASKPAAERQRLQAREKALLDAHQRQWLGELAPYLLEQQGLSPWRLQQSQGHRLRLARGWAHSLYLAHLDVELARRLVRAPLLRLLRELVIEDVGYLPPQRYQAGPDVPEGSEYPCLHVLRTAPWLPSVRVLRIGEVADEDEHNFSCQANGEGTAALVARMPRVEELRLFAHEVEVQELFELPTLTHLRVLQVYHLHEYPLDKLAANPALGRLTHLLLHPGHFFPDDGADIRLEHIDALARSPHLRSLTHLQLRLSDAGDAGCEVLVKSGLLRRLRSLDLQHGCITDAGARLLAACPDVARLERLDLGDNELTDEGARALRDAGAPLHGGDDQHHAGDDEWCYQADIE
jgi:uncharacterized protein (TIGR02996 family)